MNLKMIRRLLAAAACAALFSVVYAPAIATQSPNGPGQPGAPQTTCGSPGATSQPAGLTTPAFLNNATAKYAGSPGTPSLANGSPKAVSQYDIACFQNTQNVSGRLITVKSETAKDHGSGG